MKTRVIASVLTLAALSLAAVPSFAYGSHDGRYDGRYASPPSSWQGVAPSEPVHGSRDRREWREHDRRGYDHGGYAYQQPAYVYQQPGYVYQQPAYVYQQPQYYGQYDDGAADVVLGAILGGVISQAIANR